MKLKVIILTLFLHQIIQAQKSEMISNKNHHNSEFEANEKLKIEFDNVNKTNSEFKVIAKLKNESKISVFIQNISSDSISVLLQDSGFYIIQEAKIKNGKWKPIEYWQYSDCGNSFSSIKIGPKK